ncbi:MAG: efflux RND transporter periplasmic adaptor subunit [Caulobacteraceae bacterium]
MTPKRKRLVFILAAVAVVVVLVVARGMIFAKPKGPRYLTAPVATANIEQTVLASGTLEPRDLVEIGAQASGQVKSLNVVLGQQVKKGQVIAIIDPSNQLNNLRNAQAQLAQQKAQRLSQEATLKLNELALKRQSITLAADASSQADYEQADATLKSSRAALAVLDAQIEQATASLEKAKVDLGYTSVIAPMDGSVVAIVTKQGQTVNAVQTAPVIVKLANLGVMTIKAQISEADVIRVKPGQKVYFTILGAPDHRYYATLREVEPAPDSIKTSSTATTTSTSTSTAVYYNGLFDVENTGGELRTSMTAQVYVVLGEARGATAVPSAALGDKRPDGSYPVRVLGADGKASPRMVRIGLNNNVQAEVLSGLKPGEKVIVGEGAANAPPPPAIRPGQGGPGGPGGGRPPGAA